MNLQGVCGSFYRRCADRLQRIVWLICLCLPAACVVSPESSPPAAGSLSTAQREAKLLAMDSFEFNGGFGIWTDDESVSARINWLQTPESLSVHLAGPIGLGNMHLLGTQGIARLQRGDVLVASGPSVDQVLQRGLGLSVPVPVEQLKLWVRGLPGNASSVKRDERGKLTDLQFKDGTGTDWRARFKRYTEVGNVTVPSLITATGGPYSVRLLLKNWQLVTTSLVPEGIESNKRLAIPSR